MMITIWRSLNHPSEVKRDGICIYCKNTLPLKVLDIHILQECINFEIKTENKLCNFITLSLAYAIPGYFRIIYR